VLHSHVLNFFLAIFFKFIRFDLQLIALYMGLQTSVFGSYPLLVSKMAAKKTRKNRPLKPKFTSSRNKTLIQDDLEPLMTKMAI